MLWPEPGDAVAWEAQPLPGLERLLARSSFTRLPARPWEAALALCFGLDDHAPFGALRMRGEPKAPPAGKGEWLCADPVHLKFHHERVVLADTAGFPLSEAESQQFVAALNREFADIGTFYAAHPHRWYLRLNDPVPCHLPPLSSVAGRTLDGQLPQGAESARLKRWLNEIQMFLHHQPANEARAAAGLPTINGLWLWGGGHDDRPENADAAAEHARATPDFADFAPHFSGIWCSDPLASGLALAGGIPTHPTPPDLEKLLALAGPGNHYLVVLDDALRPALYQDQAVWRQALAHLEARWFAPLAFASASLHVAILAPTIYGLLRWDRRPGDRWKFWRKAKPLATLARELAT